MKIDDKILITGGSGLVGNALSERLKISGYTSVYSLSSKDCDLMNLENTLDLFMKIQPDVVFHLAAQVYGIMGNMKNKGMSFLRNTLINTHVIEASRQANVEKIVAMGSGCVYPYPSPGLPLSEHMVWQGEPHPSENSYAHSKRAMLAQLNAYSEDYKMKFAFVISGNLFGPHDKFDPDFGHVTPSLVRKFYEAKRDSARVNIWGNGSAKRDFMYSDDVADALMIIMDKIEGPVNMGSGNVSSIRNIVDILADYTGMVEKVDWDSSKPNGQDYREYELSKLKDAGFKAKVSLEEGLKKTYDWYVNNYANSRW
jgi:GDP-L-fucose synthase